MKARFSKTEIGKSLNGTHWHLKTIKTSQSKLTGASIGIFKVLNNIKSSTLTSCVKICKWTCFLTRSIARLTLEKRTLKTSLSRSQATFLATLAAVTQPKLTLHSATRLTLTH